MQLKIHVGQLNFTVGSIVSNSKKIIDCANKAKINSNPDLLIFPELAICGYPPEDLLFRNDFVKNITKEIKILASKLPNNQIAIIGSVTYEKNKLFNSAIVIKNKKIIAKYHKQKLPNYGVFDEKRYFSKGNKSLVFSYKNTNIGIVICEDAWSRKTITNTTKKGAELIIVINASPYQINKHKNRTKLISKRAIENNVAIVYVNSIGGQDELVFDGGSFMVDNKGKIVTQMPFFEECSLTIKNEKQISFDNNIEKQTYKAITLATRDYIIKNGFKSVILGLSGGIDSALTLAIAVDAIGGENVYALMMPSPFTTEISINDAKKQANVLKVNYCEIDIKPIFDEFNNSLNPIFQDLEQDITEENIQARIRGILLMAISNKFNRLLLATSNKSETAVGYATIYGDMCGGFAPLKDIAKTLVYRLANYRNTISEIIPNRVIERPPSAELRHNQLDSDSLPDYETLDAIIDLFVEQKLAVTDIVKHGFDKVLVTRITKLILRNEYKRRQAPPGPKITKNAFGKERRYPITSGYAKTIK